MVLFGKCELILDFRMSRSIGFGFTRFRIEFDLLVEWFVCSINLIGLFNNE